MKILFVVNSLVGGGAEKVFMNMLYCLDKDKYSITVLSIDDDGIYREDIKKIAEYKTIIHHADNPRLLHYFLGAVSLAWAVVIKWLPASVLHQMFIHDKYDVEVAYLEGMSTKVVAGSKNKKSFKIAWVHTDVIANPWTRKQFRNVGEENYCYHKMDQVIAVSDDVKKSVEQKFPVCAQTMYNVLDDKYILQTAKNGMRRFQKQKEVSFISVGSLWHIKGYMRLLKIFRQLIKENYSIELHLIGTGEDEKSLKAFIRQNKMDGWVTMHGFQREPYDLMSCADVYICSSYAEGLSTTVAEALILGLPVITTDCAGMRDLLGDSEYGYITENKGTSLKHGIQKFLDNPDVVAYYREKAAERGRDLMAENRIPELDQLFQNAVARKRKLKRP